MGEQDLKRIAVLSNVTMDMVISKLDREFRIYVPEGFDTWQQEVFNLDSALYRFSPDAVYVILYVDPYSEDWQSLKQGEERIRGWLSALNFLRNRETGIPIFVSSLDIRKIRCHAACEDNDTVELETCWIKGIEALDGICLLPMKEEIADLGRRNFYSPKLWYLGSSPYSLKGSAAVAELMRRYYFYAKGARKKCLAVDLDNTLWGGVIGEDGVDGIVLSSHGEGGRYYDMQKCLKRMKDNGVMLAVISKNNQEDVSPVFQNPYMLLKETDFAGQKINWEPKTQNIRKLAEELNIGLDAFVFLDDNPAEREEMKAECPEVEVLDFPQDTSLLPEAVQKAYDQFFKPLYITWEDMDRTEEYLRQSKRSEVQRESASVGEYLQKLEIVADIHCMRPDEKKRVVQLAGKSNQFNVTTIRYDEGGIEELQKREDADIIVGYMEDKFGKEGLTAVLVIIYGEETAAIESFIMSCRVMGREFENVIMDAAFERIRTIKPEMKRIQAQYIKTAKNRPVEKLYERLGFHMKETAGNETEDGYIKIYETDIRELKRFSNHYKGVWSFEEKGD